jgi:hypothetical protein
MTDDGWRMTDDGWRMTDDGWRMTDDKWRMTDDRTTWWKNATTKIQRRWTSILILEAVRSAWPLLAIRPCVARQPIKYGAMESKRTAYLFGDKMMMIILMDKESGEKEMTGSTLLPPVFYPILHSP